MRIILKTRSIISSFISRKLIPKSFSIISDDCWGGQIYKQLHLPYLTPTIGLWIDQSDYINYIKEFKTVHNNNLIIINSNKSHPVASIAGIKINFMHYNNANLALKKYWDRYSRVDTERIYYKIDFGKPGYTKSDIERWNKLRLKQSIAFYPSTMELPIDGIYNGVEVKDWQPDGAKMFDITRRYFNIFHWLQNGNIQLGIIYKLMNLLLFDPTAPRRIIDKIVNRQRKASARP